MSWLENDEGSVHGSSGGRIGVAVGISKGCGAVVGLTILHSLTLLYHEIYACFKKYVYTSE
jgi:hypothetical protein